MTAEEIRRLLERRQKELVKVYQEAYTKLKKRLQEQELRGLSTYQTEALLNDIGQITEGLKNYVEDWIRENYSLGYEEGSTEAVQNLNKKYGIRNIDVSFGGIHQSAVEAIVNDTFRDIAAATGFMEDGLKQAIRDAAKEKYTIGLIAGDTRRNITKGLLGELNQKGFTAYYDEKGRYISLREYANALLEENWVGFVDKAGRRWDLLNYSEMLTRTKMAETVTRGTENRLAQNGFDLVIITSHGAEDWCRFYENKIFSISGRTEGYPKLEDAPNGGTPFHPRCKHREAPFVEKFESEETINYGKQLEPKFKELNTKDGHADQAALRKLERDTLKPNPRPNVKPQNIPFQKAKTLDEAKEWAEKKFPHIAWDFRGTGVDNLNPTLKTFDDLAEQYPEVVNRIKYIGTHKDSISPEYGYKWETGALAHASRDGAYIGINPNYYGGTFQKFTALTKKAAEQGFHPTVCNNVESILTHEFGHQVYNWIESTGGETTKKLRQFCTQNLTRDKAKTVSVYACYNEREAWAETFAALRHGETENEVVNVMKEFLEEIKNL